MHERDRILKNNILEAKGEEKTKYLRRFLHLVLSEIIQQLHSTNTESKKKKKSDQESGKGCTALRPGQLFLNHSCYS